MSVLREIERDSVIELSVAAKEALAPHHAFFIIRPISLGGLEGLFREDDVLKDFTALTPTQAFEIAIPVDIMGGTAVDITIRRASNAPLVDLAEIEESNKGYARRLSIAGIKSVTGTASLYVQADTQNKLVGRGSLFKNIFAGTADETDSPYIIVGVGRFHAIGPLWISVWRYQDLSRLVRPVPVVVSEQVEV